MTQLGFFDIAERSAKLTQVGDPLAGLNSQISWEAFRADLNRVHQKDSKSNPGIAKGSSKRQKRCQPDS